MDHKYTTVSKVKRKLKDIFKKAIKLVKIKLNKNGKSVDEGQALPVRARGQRGKTLLERKLRCSLTNNSLRNQLDVYTETYPPRTLIPFTVVLAKNQARN